MRPDILFYLWIVAPIVFVTVVLFSAAKPGADKRNRAVIKDRGHHWPFKHA